MKKSGSVLNLNPLEVNIRNSLKAAVIEENKQKIEIIIKKFSDANMSIIEELNQALIVAFEKHKPKMIEFLIDKGAEINARREGSLMTPVFEAAIEGNLDWFKKIFDEMTQEVKLKLINSRDLNEETPLFVMIKQDKPFFDLIKFFVENGAEINIINRNGKSLSAIIKQKCPEFIKNPSNEISSSNPIDVNNPGLLNKTQESYVKKFDGVFDVPKSGNYRSSNGLKNSRDKNFSSGLFNPSSLSAKDNSQSEYTKCFYHSEPNVICTGKNFDVTSVQDDEVFIFPYESK